ncbi:prepilin-type N-terminal cleavage/methylation domain-containing protein [Anaerostipes sp.]|uniref:prepilin-type N-terminal cleavage/methylation domain-containing protein n=1 Tax=Anaerostipes sp. TaxID=1872530 RepID=UPI0025BCF40A|nr:prepilin-type N-terminal cleavage/methylation domain-containing protein [Anaerostipes sp.]MBS7009300.1 prepilin-type N-terminal cleavage/methylation domain-containing protein [Anaerostipes sp.]
MRKKLSDFRQKLRKDKKGFTLVELIVVLVILAILIALLIPTLTGYIDNANKKKVQSEGRQVLMAAQTLAEDDYVFDGTKTMCGVTAGVPLNTKPAGAGDPKDPDIATLAEVTGKYKGDESHVKVDAAGKVTEVVYTDKDGKFEATYTNTGNNGSWTVKKK